MGNSIHRRKQHERVGKKERHVARKEFELLAFGFQACISNNANNNSGIHQDATANNTELSSCKRTLHLPSKSIVREIISGGNFTVFRTFSNKLFIKHIGEAKKTSGNAIRLSGKVARFKYQKVNHQKNNDQMWGDNLKRLQYKIGNNTDLGEIHCSNHSICLRMKDDSITIFDDYSKSMLHITDYKSRNELKSIYSGSLASTFIFVNNRNQVDLCKHKEYNIIDKNYEPFTFLKNVPLPEIFGKSTIIKGVCGAEKSFIIIENCTDGSHQLCSFNDTSQQFEIVPTLFQGERIQDISCGYRHMAAILECGDVFLSTSTSEISFKLIQFPLFPFIKLNEPPKRRSNPNRKQEVSKDPYALIYERDQMVGTIKPFIPQRVLCSSLATFFLNDKGCIILGQPCNDVTPTFLFDDGSSAFYHAFNEDGLVPNSEISVGGWHFSFHQTKLISKTSLQYFQSNFKYLTDDNTTSTSDITIICQ